MVLLESIGGRRRRRPWSNNRVCGSSKIQAPKPSGRWSIGFATSLERFPRVAFDIGSKGIFCCIAIQAIDTAHPLFGTELLFVCLPDIDQHKRVTKTT